MKKYFIPVSISMLFLMSCLQENLEPSIIPDWPTTDPKPKVSRIKTDSYNDETTTYTYDNLGRITHEQNYDGSFSDYTYDQNSVDHLVYDTSGSLKLIETYDLNAKGLAIKSTRTDVPAGIYFYEYNSADQLVKTTSDVPSGKYERFITYKNGNVDMEEYKQDSILKYTYHYTYYSDSPNVLENKYYGRIYLGKESKDLLKSWYGVGQNGSIFFQSASAYTFDNQGRVATRSVVNSHQTENWKFTY